MIIIDIFLAIVNRRFVHVRGVGSISVGGISRTHHRNQTATYPLDIPVCNFLIDRTLWE